MTLLSSSTVNINPDIPIPLSGIPDTCAQHISDSLEINSILLHNNDHAIVILSSDTLFVPEYMAATMSEMIAKKYNNCCIFFSSTHTHNAPGIDHSKQRLGATTPVYIRRYEHALYDLVDKLLNNHGEEVNLSYGSILANHCVNRRKKVFTSLAKKSISTYPNLNGAKDETIHALVCTNLKGQLRSLLWSYGCHALAVPFRNTISADYPGAVRRHLRQQYDAPDLPVVFIPGFAGNVLPRKIAKDLPWRRPLSLLNRLAHGPPFGQFSPEEYSRWADGLSRHVQSAATAAGLQRIDPKFAFAACDIPLHELTNEAPAGGRLRIQAARLSANHILLSLSAEVVTEYLSLAAEAFPGDIVIPASCLAGTFGYLPTQKLLDQGGYEADRFFTAFSLEGGSYKPLPEQRIFKAFQLLSKELEE